ncbi:SA1320 family protein [Isobaculum melis]|uniref:Uncharacterized protein n=1 Tax=Isobaculum melis TaxID=142588 RepID=A0A1H9S114_9LACT|nr:hypothetical protein [Isobaculum melis]SER78325.1 hypothetical protein SAMN04488559_1063 [Isobaculum melis]
MAKQQISHEDLIRLGGDTVYKELEIHERVEINGKIFVIKDIISNPKTGLQAITVSLDGTDEYAVIYQGTQPGDGGNDYLTDASLLTDKIHPQLDAASQYYNDMYKKYGNIKYVGGNSLGGGLANYVTYKNGWSNVHSVVLNPAIIPEIGDVDDPERYTNYLTQYDPLTLAEKGIGLKDRIPGHIHDLVYGIPIFGRLVSNHVGYVKDDDGNLIGVEIETPDGQKVWLNLQVDAFLPVSIFSGNILGRGNGEKVEITPDILALLSNQITDKLLEWFRQISRNNETVSILIGNEKNKFEIRVDELKGEVEAIFSSGGMNFFETWANVKESLGVIGDGLIGGMGILSEIPKLAPIKIPFITDVATVLPSLIQLIDTLSDFFNEIKTKHVPALFEDVDRGFSDGVVSNLSKHHRMLEGNISTLDTKVRNYASQIDGVRITMVEMDRALAAGIEPQIIGIPTFTNTVLKEEKYLEGWKALNETLDKNYKTFTKNIEGRFVSLLTQIKDKVEGLLDIAETIESSLNTVANMIDIPWFEFDDNLRENAREFNSFTVRPIKSSIEGIITGIAAMIANFPNLLENFKPYVKHALFINSNYETVLILNEYNYGILESIYLTFNDMQYHLQENKAEAISRLGNVAMHISNDFGTVQYQMGQSTLTKHNRPKKVNKHPAFSGARPIAT